MSPLQRFAMRSLPSFTWIAVIGLLAASSNLATAGDWNRFRGPNGSGVSEDPTPTPVTWSPTQNLKWKVTLPGPGSSSPIIVGDKIFLTCWSGYGTERGNRGGSQENLKRHLICLNRQSGETVWDKTVDPYLPEDDYGGMFAEHGYATHTPVSDGERVYVFFGKTGALAFDLKGNQLWKQPLGTGSDRMGWGSGCSPILYKNLVIVTASAESQTLYALDKLTGKEVWRSEAEGFGSTWGTPILVDVDENRTDLVIGVPYEVWGFNPDTGKLRWFCDALNLRSFCSSVITDGKLIYAMGDQGAGSIAIKPGGENDVTKSHVVWTGRDSNRIGTPVFADGRLYYFSNKVANCVDAKTSTKIYQARLVGSSQPAETKNDGERQPPEEGRGPEARGGRAGNGGRGGQGRGGMGGQDYSSPVVADGKLYFIARNGDAYVMKLGDQFEQLATNRVTEDAEDFSATPAICNGEIFIRSSKHLYCVTEKAAAK